MGFNSGFEGLKEIRFFPIEISCEFQLLTKETLSGVSGIVVSMLASGTQVRGLKPG